MAAFAIDVGYHRVVRGQLQNAADATALAACKELYPRTPAPVSAASACVGPATAEAGDAVGINEADKKTLTDVSVLTGLVERRDAFAARSVVDSAIQSTTGHTSHLHLRTRDQGVDLQERQRKRRPNRQLLRAGVAGVSTTTSVPQPRRLPPLPAA